MSKKRKAEFTFAVKRFYYRSTPSPKRKLFGEIKFLMSQGGFPAAAGRVTHFCKQHICAVCALRGERGQMYARAVTECGDLLPRTAREQFAHTCASAG